MLYEYTSPWAGVELTTLVVIDTDCIGYTKLGNDYLTLRGKRPRGLIHRNWVKFTLKMKKERQSDPA
jgi:hypothetical protein